MSVSDKYDRLIRDINEERAAALRRISGTLESLIDQLQVLRQQLPDVAAAERPRLLDTYDALRAQAVLYRWFLEVQRESLGLRNHELVDQYYPIPAAIER